MTSAREQTAVLVDLLRREHSAMADFLVALAEVDRNRVWEALGHAGASSPSSAASSGFPPAPRSTGRPPPSSSVVTRRSRPLRPVENPPRREVVTALRAEAAHAAACPSEASSRALSSSDAPPAFRAPEIHVTEGTRAGSGAEPVHARAAHSVSVEPLTADLRRLHLTVSRRLLDKLAAARDALSHSHPGAGADEIIEAGLDLLLERHARRRGLVKNPRTTARNEARNERKPTNAPLGTSGRPTVNPSPRGHRRHVPAAVMRAVWTRDGGRCQWPLDGGGICGSTHQLELDHVVPVGRGGASTVENLRCLCDIHNDVAAREVYGDEWMDGFTRGKASAPPFRSSRA